MCDLPASCFWASQATANYISSASLLVSALTLVFLIIYVRATGKIAKASVEQVEASFRPAIVAQSESGSVAAFPLLKNIGKGPAMEIEWSIPNSTFHGKIPYLEPTVSQKLPLPEGGPKILTNAALKGGENKASIECTYQSISGKSYSSSNEFDFNQYQFVTHFSKEELA